MKKRSMVKLCIIGLLVLIGFTIWFMMQHKMFEFHILLAIIGVIIAILIMLLVLAIVKSGLFKEMSEDFAVAVCDSVISRRSIRQMNELEKRFDPIGKLYDELEDLRDEIEQSDSSKEDEKKLIEYINRETNALETKVLSMTEEEKEEKKSLIDDMKKTLNEIRDDIISEEEKRKKMLQIAELKQIVIETQKEARDFCVAQSEELKKQIAHKSQYLISEAKKIAKKSATSGQELSKIELDEALEILKNEKGFKLAYTKESLTNLQEEFEEVQEKIKDLNGKLEIKNEERESIRE